MRRNRKGKEMHETTLRILKAKNRANVAVFWMFAGYFACVGIGAVGALWYRWDAILNAGR